MLNWNKDREWNVGDDVVVHTNYNVHLGKVQRVTKTQLVVNGYKFRRENGNRVGSNSYALWWITEPTEKDLEEFRKRKKKDAVIASLKKVIENYNSLSEKQVDYIIDFFEQIDSIIDSVKTT